MPKTESDLSSQSRLLEGLNDEQKAAVTHGEGPLLIVAGAGTGKTTVITRRIAYLIEQGLAKPEEILALAFGDKAANEMEERADQLLPLGYYNLQISTFHSFGEQILREWGLEIGLPEFKVLDEVGQWLMIRNNLEKFELDYYRPLGNPTKFIKALVSHFSRAKDELITPEEYLGYAEKMRLDSDLTPSQSPPIPPTQDRGAGGEREREVANAYHVYQKLLLQNNALDFGDLINYSLKLFQNRPKVLETYRKRFKYILVDEFQDTNFAQYELLKLLAAPQNNLTVVGDDDQSIYKFRGASISNILHFQKDYSSAKFISLTDNYRSGQEILDLAYRFIQQNNPDRLEVRLKLSKKLKAHQTKKGEIETLLAPDYAAEAKLVIEKILELKSTPSQSPPYPSNSAGKQGGEKKRGSLPIPPTQDRGTGGEGEPTHNSPQPSLILREGEEGEETGGEREEVSWNDFAILARSHEALEPFINQLEASSLPYIYFANKGLYRKKIIRDLLAYFKLLDNYHESAALYRVLNFSIFNLSQAAIIELTHYAHKKSLSLFEALKEAAAIKGLPQEALRSIKKLLTLLEKHTALAGSKSVVQVYVQVFTDLEFDKEVQESAKYIEAFSRKIQNFINESEDKTLKAFTAQVTFELEAGELGQLEFDPEAGPEAVKLLTVHGAKGLEFTYVFVVSLVDKRFPTIERKELIEIPQELIKDILPVGDIHLEEERRLMYVAMTRAKEGLILSYAKDYGGKRLKKPSRFLQELGFTEKEALSSTGQVLFIPSSVRLRRTPSPARGEGDKVGLALPKYFSFSQISLFRKCPLEYKYRYVLKLPVPGAAQLSFGSTIHKTLERYLKAYKQSQNHQDLFGKSGSIELPALDSLLKLYEQSWIDDWYESRTQKQEYKKLGQKILRDFYEHSKQNLPLPKYLETAFKIRLDDSWFIGKLDRADEAPEGLLIIDYKTGQAKTKLSPVDKQQLLVYQWGAQEYYQEKVKSLQYWFLKDTLQSEEFLGTAEDLTDLRADFLKTIAEIKEAVKKDNFAELDRRISHDCEYRDLEA